MYAVTTRKAKEREPGTHAATSGRERESSVLTAGLHAFNEALLVRMGECTQTGNFAFKFLPRFNHIHFLSVMVLNF